MRNARWYHGNIVLIGDAAHTAHFSIGSGTKLAMEDAIALARVLDERPDLRACALLERYEDERRTEALRLQNAARNSMEWFENVRALRRTSSREQFAYSLLTRSQRVSHENLRLRDRDVSRGRGALVREPRGRARRKPPTRRRRCSRRSACAA